MLLVLLVLTLATLFTAQRLDTLDGNGHERTTKHALFMLCASAVTMDGFANLPKVYVMSERRNSGWLR